MAAFCILFGPLAQSQAHRKINLAMKNAPLTAVLAAIEKQTGTPFVFNRQQVEKVAVTSAFYQQKSLTGSIKSFTGTIPAWV